MRVFSQPRLTKGLIRARHVSPYVAEIGLVALFIALFIYKIRMMAPAAIEPLQFSVLHHDSMIFGSALILYALASFSMRNRLLFPSAYILRAAVLIVATIYLVDVAAYKFFSTRLYWADLVVFSSEAEGNLSLLRVAVESLFRRSWWKIIVVLAVIALAVYLAAVFLMRPASIKSRYSTVSMAIGVVLCFFATISFPPSVYSYVDKPLYENVFERNSDYFNPKVFSEEFRDAVLTNFDDAQVCTRGKGEKRDIVLLIVESLSAYHSHLISGINNFTPRMDELAREYTILTNFHANSWTTIGGLISILTTSWPLVPENAEFNTWGSPRLEYFDSPSESLPNYLRREGYTTAFLAGGDLSFTNIRRWLDAIGFEKIIDGSEIDYSDSIRGPFNSIPDSVLMSEALSYIEKFDPTRSELLVVQTFWGHRPWTSPSQDYPDTEEGTFRYIDAQVHDFYAAMLDMGYFQSGGLLLIVGDHRGMTPFSESEIDRFGASAASRLFMIIVGDDLDLPSTIDFDFQQHDILPSIAALVSDQYCRSSYAGAFLGQTLEPPRCIFHARGDDRDLVHIKCGELEGNVLIDGDSTRVIHGNLIDEKFVIDKINYERIRPD